MQTIEIIDLVRSLSSSLTTDQRIAFAIYCALGVYDAPGFAEWAEGWLSGRDRSRASAAAAAADAAYAYAAAAADAAYAAAAADAAYADAAADAATYAAADAYATAYAAAADAYAANVAPMFLQLCALAADVA